MQNCTVNWEISMIVSYKVNLSDFALRSMYDYIHDHEIGMVQKNLPNQRWIIVVTF